MATRQARRGVEQEVEQDCVLCPPLRFRLNAMADLPGEPAVLAADDDFFLMPDLAPLVDGHVLLVTTRHVQCAGAFGEGLWAKAWQWRHRVAGVYRTAYGSDALLMFEHGPATSQGGGACIDHAHWHLMPRRGTHGPYGVRDVLEEGGHHGEAATRDAVHRHFRSGRSYLLLDEAGTVTVHPGDGVPGQYLRWATQQALDHDGSGGPEGAEKPEERSWRWQETFVLPASRERFLRTLDVLRAAVAADDDRQRAAERAANHQ